MNMIILDLQPSNDKNLNHSGMGPLYSNNE